MFPHPVLNEYGNVITKPNIKKIVGGGMGTTGLLMDDGRLYATGFNYTGEYGNGSPQGSGSYNKWTLVRTGVDDVCCNTSGFAGTFIIRQGTQLYYTGSLTPITGESYNNQVTTYAAFDNINKFLTDPDDYVKEMICSYHGAAVLIRNERLGTGKVYTSGAGFISGTGLNTNSWGKFTISTTAPTNVIKLQAGYNSAGLYLISSDNKLYGTGYNNRKQIDSTSTSIYYSWVQIDTDVYNVEVCNDYILYLKSDGIHRIGDTSKDGVPSNSSGTLVTKLTFNNVADYNRVLFKFNVGYAALYVPPGVECTLPTNNGVNISDTINKQFTIFPGTENKEIQELTVASAALYYKSDDIWYTYKINSSGYLVPNINNIISIPV